MNRLLGELRRRNVFRVAAAYLVVGWLLLQVVTLIEEPLGLPGWTDTFIIVLLGVGFPVALILAWAFEMTPEGMKLTVAVPDGESIAPQTGRKLDYAIAIGLALLVGVIVWQQMSTPVITVSPRSQMAETERPGEATIAVLPFADLSAAGDKEYFGDGIAEEILNVLARTDGLDVTSRTSAFAFKSQSALSIRDIAAALHVRHILEGSIRVAGDTIRVTAQLIDAETDQHLWSDTYDHELTAENLFAIQDEIAVSITEELTRAMGIEIGAAPTSTAGGGTSDISAYDAYLEGRTLFINRNYENLPRAIERLEYATETDPNFLRAWAQLAVAYAVAPGWAMFEREYAELASSAAERALALDPDNSLALTAIAQRAAYQADFVRAVEYYERAIASDPQNTTALLWLAQAMRELGFFERGLEIVGRCLDIDPDYAVCLYTNAELLANAGRHDESLEALVPLMSTQHADSYGAFLGILSSRNADLLMALLLREIPDFMNVDGRWMVTDLLRALSDEDYDRHAALVRFEARLVDQGVDPRADPYAAMTHLLAFRAYNEVPTQFVTAWWWFREYPGLTGSEAARAAMIANNLPDYWRVHGYPPQCRAVGRDDFACD